MSDAELTRMLAGEWYFPSNKTLFAMRESAKQLCFELNQCPPSDRKGARKYQKKLLPHVKSAWIEAPFYCDYGCHIHAGHGLFLNHGVTILDAAPVTFGEQVLVGPGVLISTATHPTDPDTRKKGLEQALPVTIGDNVWIGMGAKILPGVSIGHDAIIAAGAVVNRNVEAGQTVAGVPAKVIKPVPRT